MGDQTAPSISTQQDRVIESVNEQNMAFTRVQYENFFRHADKDEDGYLSLKELRSYFREQGYNGTESAIRRMFRAADVDVDDKISYDEFLRAMGQAPDDYAKSSLLRRVFALFDRDGSGEIDKKELKHIFSELGRHMRDDEVQRVMELADKDGSGTLNYEEFLEVLAASENPSLNKRRR